MQNKKTILIGEDRVNGRGRLEMALRSLGYAVEVARDGEEVLFCVRSSRAEIGAVLLDLSMPSGEGLETLREVREARPDVPLIAISEAVSPIDVVSAMKMGASDFLCKPVAAGDLRAAVER